MSRTRIVEAAIVLLDSAGERALTFRALAAHLDTGLGAIYYHLTDKADLVAAACDTIVAQVLSDLASSAEPKERVRQLGLALYDAMDQHPWLGSTLPRVRGLSVVRILEPIGQSLVQLKVPLPQQWSTASALLHYILGVGGQTAASSQVAQLGNTDRESYLEAAANEWAALDPVAFAFVRSVADQLLRHSDRQDFLAGLDLILAGTRMLTGESNTRSKRKA
ncbi:helix-turn-helix domain-containing protein [Variovorax dokdonensis]|uniref:Helix-turn-helix domain-containing protein n=1 Tax=Variovorax dokdonensis TaxID=344883 RepID=A0ABT7N941_9BURK|nr:helix-turn-helix domain-containing protein [Variovorax dokdonensis]MDM0044439.1 helix-turn-helix domain-containing protein [Variovorax dokdonensis]